MQRRIESLVRTDLKKKMVFVAGPRQCGKTTLALSILQGDESNPRYINWDTDAGREAVLTRMFPSGPGTLVLDEIHKYPRWRNLLKGLFDSRKRELSILVTGSARLDAYRRGGDSLQGRYQLIRMHPLAFWELPSQNQSDLERLLKLGGFPEPYLSGSETEARRWSRSYRSRVIREELISLEHVSDISKVEELSMRLPECVGSPLSTNSLREDLGISHVTATRWLLILENLYQIYRIYPFGSPRIKAVKKESKHFHYDWNLIEDPGARFENFIASHFLNYCHWIEDSQGYAMELRHFRDREQREVDLVLMKDRKPIGFIECKLRPQASTPSLRYLKAKHPNTPATQVSLEATEDRTDAYHIRHCDAVTLLRDFSCL